MTKGKAKKETLQANATDTMEGESDSSGKNKAGVLSAMQTALGNAMEEMGRVSKLLQVLQTDINQIKVNNTEL